jgi:hypothetical protein
MTRKLRSIGLALIAAFAISAIGASAAQATQFHTKGAAYPATVTGVNVANQVFHFHVETGKNNELNCKKGNFSGTLTKASTTLTVHPVYTACTFSGAAATVTTTNCDYVLNAGAKKSPGEYAGTLDIECAAAQFISVTTAECEIRIAPQNGLKELVFVNLTGSGTILTEFNISAFAYSVTKDAAGCPLTGMENRVDGTTTLATGVTFSAVVGGTATPITVE